MEKSQKQNINILENCSICPRNCQVNRLQGNLGFCDCSDKIEIALASIHNYEEPCISGTNGSGTIFFSHCNLKCIYCQNYEISQQGKGKEITIMELADIFLKQQEKKVHNINLVTPTMYAYQIKEAIKIARKNGLTIPIVYNTNAYESIETIKMLDGYVDIYLPDLKYASSQIALKYSKASNYFEVATKAIKQMYKQVGTLKLDNKGIAKKGILIRHLILPSYLQNTKHILKWVKENMPSDTYISLMAQYFPTYLAKKDQFINRKLTKKEYEEIENYFYTLNFKNGYIQELGEHEEEYVPNWNIK